MVMDRKGRGHCESVVFINIKQVTMKVNESFAVEATEEVRKDPPKYKYVLDVVNPNDIPHRNTCVIRMGSDLTSEEVKIMEDALNKQPFHGSREYDQALMDEWNKFALDNGYFPDLDFDKKFLDHKYGKPNESILKQIAEHKAKIEELEKQLR